MANFNKRIEAMWPDKDVDGWMEVQLECGHLTHEPKGNTNKRCHCGTCMLNHQEHLRELKRIQKEQEVKAPGGPPHHG